MKSRRLLAVRTAKELSGELLELSALKHSQELPQEHDAFNDGCRRAAFVFRSAAGRFSLSTQRGKGLKSRSTNQKFNPAGLVARVCQDGMVEIGRLDYSAIIRNQIIMALPGYVLFEVLKELQQLGPARFCGASTCLRLKSQKEAEERLQSVTKKGRDQAGCYDL